MDNPQDETIKTPQEDILAPQEVERSNKNGLENENETSDLEKKSDGWLTQEQLNDIKSNIEAGIEYQKLHGRWERWNEYLDYLNCRWDLIHQDSNGNPLLDTANINTIFSNHQTEIPTLYFQQPDVSVKPEKPYFTRYVDNGFNKKIPVLMDNFHAAKLLGKRLNNLLKNIRAEQVVERWVGDCLAPYGYGVLKVGYGFVTEASKDLNQAVDKTTFWLRRVDPRNVVFDPLAPSFYERTWLAEKIIRSKSALRKNTIYEPKIVESLNTKIPEILEKRINKIGKGWDPKLVEYWEYHDEETHMIHWISIDGVPKELREPYKKEEWIEGSDYILLSLNATTDDSIYPLSDIDPVIDQAKARNKISTAQMKFFENMSTSIFYEEGAFKSEEDKEQWRTAGNGMCLVKVPIGTISGNKLQVVPPPTIPRDWYQLDENNRRINDETLGISDYQRGNPEKRTATEASLVNNAVNVRISYRRRKIKNAIVEMVRKLASLVRQHDDQKTILNIADQMNDEEFVVYLKEKYGFDGDVPFLEVSKEDWQGEYNFDFDIEEMVERPKSVQIQQLTNTLTQITQIPLLAQTFAENFDPEKALAQLFELQGMMIESVSKSDKGQIPPEVENQMAEDGRQIPEPHKKDKDDLHIVTHLGRVREIQSQVPNLIKGANTGDQRAIEALQRLQVTVQNLQQHVVQHQSKKMKQAQIAQTTGAQMPGQPGIQQQMNGPDMQSQINPQSIPQGPTEMQVNQNAGIA